MAEETAAEAEAPTEPTHEPFSLKVLSTVQAHRSLNGLRHQDHLRYRQYCTRKLRRLYVLLRFKHGKGRYKQVAFPENFADPRWLYVPLVQAERDWAFGVQLKADNATAAAYNARWRRRSVKRFARAVAWAHQLQEVCKVHCDQRTQMDVEAYAAFLEGTCCLEKEMWSEAKTKLLRCKKLCDHLLLISDQADAGLFRNQIQELTPMLRECRYNLGEAEDEDEKSKERSVTGGKGSQGTAELSYRGHAVSLSSEKVRKNLMKCLETAKSLQAGADSADSTEPAVIEQYGQLSVEFGETLKDIHSEMIVAGADDAAAQWGLVEAYAREVSVTLNIERNLILLRNHLATLDGIEDTSSESRRQCRVEEGMRFCDLLKEDLQSLTELPESNSDIEEALSFYSKAILNYRCLYLSLCHMSMGKLLEAAALLDMLSSRVEEEQGDMNSKAFESLHAKFERIQKKLPSRVAQWRSRVLVQLVAPSENKELSQEATSKTGSTAQKDALAAFPPRFRDIPCKPLLFDLAFPCIEPPDLDEILPKTKEGQKGKIAAVAGALGRVAGGVGGLGSKLGGLWGRK